MTVNVLWLFLTVAWVGLRCVIVVFSDHTHLLFVRQCSVNNISSNQWDINYISRVTDAYIKVIPVY